MARALIVLGEAKVARVHLLHIERAVAHSAAAAEAQVVRLAIDDAGADQELQSVLRAANVAALDDLVDVAARARRLATVHGAWQGSWAAAIAERRRQLWAAAPGAIEVALYEPPCADAVLLTMVRDI